MDHILLCTNHIPLTTSIHNSFIEDYMLEANGSYVKVYLYLAKCIQYGEQGLSISSLADRMDNTEKDILRALQYWEKKNLLKINREETTGEIAGIDMLAPALQRGTSPGCIPKTAEGPAKQPIESASGTTLSNSVMQETESEAVGAVSNVVPMPVENKAENKKTEVNVSPVQLKMLAEDQEFVWTCHVIESYMERPLKPNETRLIAYLYGTLHFSKDLLLYLYDYCISLGKTNCNYIQAVALSWDEQGVQTPEEAEQASTAYNTAYTSVARAMALDRALAPVEKKYVDRWQQNWGMDLGVILEACNRTILKLHKVDFHYTEGILEHWRQAGVHTLQDVERADQTYKQSKTEKTPSASGHQQPKNKNQFQQFQQRDTSAQEVDDLERKLVFH